jgi:hypothetical protein
MLNWKSSTRYTHDEKTGKTSNSNALGARKPRGF